MTVSSALTWDAAATAVFAWHHLLVLALLAWAAVSTAMATGNTAKTRAVEQRVNAIIPFIGTTNSRVSSLSGSATSTVGVANGAVNGTSSSSAVNNGAVNGSTTTDGLPDGTFNGNTSTTSDGGISSGPIGGSGATFATHEHNIEHTHPYSGAIANGQHSHTASTMAVTDSTHAHTSGSLAVTNSTHSHNVASV